MFITHSILVKKSYDDLDKNLLLSNCIAYLRESHRQFNLKRHKTYLETIIYFGNDKRLFLYMLIFY